jgi:hypothetical protein
MSQHQKVTTFFRHVILYDDSHERRELKRSIAPVQPGERFVKRFASVMVEFLVVVIVGVEVMVAFAGLLMCPRKTSKHLRDAHPLVTKRRDSHLGKPDITTLPGSYRGSDDRESLHGVAEGSGYHSRLDSPSWRSNRLCG